MSDPAANSEIEDVLSSIRRLVAQTRSSAPQDADTPTTNGAAALSNVTAPAFLSRSVSPDNRAARNGAADDAPDQDRAEDTDDVAEAGHVFAPLSCDRPLAERIAASNRKPPEPSEAENVRPSQGSAPALVLTPSFRILPEMVAEPEEDDDVEDSAQGSAAPIPLHLSRLRQAETQDDKRDDGQQAQADRDAIAAAITRRLSELEAGVDEHPQDWEPDGSEVIRDAPPVQWDDAEAIDVEDAFDIELARVSERVTSRVSAYVARRSGLLPDNPSVLEEPPVGDDQPDDAATEDTPDAAFAGDGLTFHTTRTATTPKPEGETSAAAAAPADADLGPIALNLDVDPGAQWTGTLAAEADALAAAAVADLERAEEDDLAEAALADGFDDEPEADDDQAPVATIPDAPLAEAGMPALAGSMELTLEEDALRDIVGEILRDELRGVLGEQITRNVRLLVRREIQRILAGREFD